MIDPADLAGLPPPDDGPAPPLPRRRPRNYLATRERRQLFWRFMPAAVAVLLILTVVEKIWFSPVAPPAAPPVIEVDTRLKTVQGPPPADGEVVVEAEPQTFEPGAAELGAPASMLAQVRDNTLFGTADREAWEQIFVTLRETGQAALLEAPAQRVSFIELFGQPRSFRGRLVRMRGTLKRLVLTTAPQNRYGIESYWDGVLKPEGQTGNPVLVHCLQVPADMPTGKEIDEPVEIVGYFLKRDVYRATDTDRVAPLVMALEPAWKPRPAVDTGGSSLGTWLLVSMVSIVSVTVLAVWLSGRSSRRNTAGTAVELAAALRGHEPFSVAEELRRLGDTERQREGQQP